VEDIARLLLDTHQFCSDVHQVGLAKVASVVTTRLTGHNRHQMAGVKGRLGTTLLLKLLGRIGLLSELTHVGAAALVAAVLSRVHAEESSVLARHTERGLLGSVERLGFNVASGLAQERATARRRDRIVVHRRPLRIWKRGHDAVAERRWLLIWLVP
jgi:hypothetical protein